MFFFCEISVVHRLGRQSNGHPRPIIIKFTRRVIKTLLMKHKANLRRSPGWENVFIDENLTTWRRLVVRRLKEHVDPRVSTTDGKILFSRGGRRYELNTGKNFLDMLDSDVVPPEFLEAIHIDPNLAMEEDRDYTGALRAMEQLLRTL